MAYDIYYKGGFVSLKKRDWKNLTPRIYYITEGVFVSPKMAYTKNYIIGGELEIRGFTSSSSLLTILGNKPFLSHSIIQ